MGDLTKIRTQIRANHRADETKVLKSLVKTYGPAKADRTASVEKAVALINEIRHSHAPGLMEVFLAEYGLSNDEGIALMCLAEALLRVPDAETIDDLIEDKIAPSEWGRHLGESSSSLVNASTWALMLTGKVLAEPDGKTLADSLKGAVKRLGEPIIRVAVTRAIKEMGKQFVLGQDIEEATTRAKTQEKKGYTYSYDMLGEAALTAHDAEYFLNSYKNAISAISAKTNGSDPRETPGISIKLSALHPRYELAQKERVMTELVPRVHELALMAKKANIGLNIDAEEADRLDLSLDVIEAVVRDKVFDGWDGFGVVVQAYGKRASNVIDWLYALAKDLDRKFMVRLVKGAYWDTEIKQAQVDGVEDFPVFTQKTATDVSYICCAKQLHDYRDVIYPQFATHNAHTVSAILNMFEDPNSFEFQRLHGMGDVLHEIVLNTEKTRCRIYAPVGKHRDLLAYLVRRLLENGANSSFVNQIVDEEVPAETIATDPFEWFENKPAPSTLTKPADLFAPERPNSVGWDLRNTDDLAAYEEARAPFKTHQWTVEPIIAGDAPKPKYKAVYNPSAPEDKVGKVSLATQEHVDSALKAARSWSRSKPATRRKVLNKAADLYEKNAGEIFAALCREAGKTAVDAVAEIREAVDFLRFYGAEAERLGDQPERGVISCISPWNFPLAIFTGQIAAALAAGNGVLAKPAEPTPIVAAIGTRLMIEAGVPASALQLLPGPGSIVGKTLTSHERVNGICFTGSTGVAQQIYRQSAENLEPDSTFIAETGGLNAMIVDSTALPEQAVQDIVDSAFRSCGQRCSALRVLYLQKDIADSMMKMLFGAMDELTICDPWDMSADLGPAITAAARNGLKDHIDAARSDGRLLKQLDVPLSGLFIGPAVIKVDGIADLEKEVFGPVLHVATFEANEVDKVIEDINASGFGLTFGLHTRIDDRVDQITKKVNVGNVYINRNQIGAIVGSQPFGGEGLSGTGPKAGGPLYVSRFKKYDFPEHAAEAGKEVDTAALEAALKAVAPDGHAALESHDMPGPTGESNRLSVYPRGTILCLGPTAKDARAQMKAAQAKGCGAVGVAPGLKGANTFNGTLDRAALTTLTGFDAVALWSDTSDLRLARAALADRDGALLPLIATTEMESFCVHERHVCIDTTASGGNASLLAEQ